ncbi:uncharacterized protein C20orf85 homolog [Tachyglossus aculeatus]|uniref:uncharacterized protein C20orf85 homolog n=1 Tax=Tachyglossus aculeatus TaxID=9261 RepID=UPI0018F76413|nr:uncharacterized protein C20orf85 homolog [Tachyglossus aculeatus]
MAQKGHSIPPQSNFVAQDQIWRCHVKTELEAAKNWPHKWGFLTTPFEKLVKHEGEEPLSKPQIMLPEHLQIQPVIPVETYIKVYPSPPIPKTTQGFIGWRSTVPGLELDHHYQIRSCKGAFSKQLNWPAEGTN